MRLILATILIMVTGSAAAGAPCFTGLYTAGCDVGDYGAPAEGGSRPATNLDLGLDYLGGYLSDSGSILVSPLSWGGSGWLKLSVVLGATLALSNEEEDVQDWVQGNRNDDTDMVSQFTRPLGSGRYVLPALCGLYGYGRFVGNEKVSRTALLSLESVIVSGFFSAAVKYLTHKQRPGPALTDDIPWRGPSFSVKDLSFPSGHSACGFAVATIVASEYSGHALVPSLAYYAAALAALSRVNDNAHWLSDVVMGSAIGHYTAKIIAERHGTVCKWDFSILPHAGLGGAGIVLSHGF